MEWALLLPAAVPTYIIAYTYTDIFEYAGPLQGMLRDFFEWENAQNYWFENLDPEGDDSADEGNQAYDPGELILKDFGATGYSSSDVWVSKYLNYDNCGNSSPCGGNSYEIFSTNYEADTKVKKVSKFESKVSLASNKVIGQVPLTGNKLNNLNIVNLDHNELEFLQLKGLLDEELIKPLYLS